MADQNASKASGRDREGPEDADRGQHEERKCDAGHDARLRRPEHATVGDRGTHGIADAQRAGCGTRRAAACRRAAAVRVVS
jgi:hypothetical protein